MISDSDSIEPNVNTFENLTGEQPINGPASGGCFKANLLRIAYDIRPEDIPENFPAISYKNYICPTVGKDGKECTFANPMVSLHKGIGLVAIGHESFCSLQSSSPNAFNKAALGSLGVRAARFGRDVFVAIRNKLDV